MTDAFSDTPAGPGAPPQPPAPRTLAQVATAAAKLHEHYREARRAGAGELGLLRRKIELMAAARGREALQAWSTDRSLPDAIRHGARDALASLPEHPGDGVREAPYVGPGVSPQ